MTYPGGENRSTRFLIQTCGIREAQATGRVCSEINRHASEHSRYSSTQLIRRVQRGTSMTKLSEDVHVTRGTVQGLCESNDVLSRFAPPPCSCRRRRTPAISTRATRKPAGVGTQDNSVTSLLGSSRISECFKLYLPAASTCTR